MVSQGFSLTTCWTRRPIHVLEKLDIMPLTNTISWMSGRAILHENQIFNILQSINNWPCFIWSHGEVFSSFPSFHKCMKLSWVVVVVGRTHSLALVLSTPALRLLRGSLWPGVVTPDRVAQSAGAVEYTDCTSAEGLRPLLTSVLDMTLNNLMVRFQQCWSFGECGVPLHRHRSLVHSGPEWQHLIGPYLWVK